jgi:hypothetical protein
MDAVRRHGGRSVARFTGVEVVAEGSAALLCIAGVQRVWVPVDKIRDGTEVAKLGDRGALVVSRQFARNVASAGAAQVLRAWRGLVRFVFGRGGMLQGRWHAVAAYHRRDFHPWRYLDNRRLLSQLRETITEPRL